MKLKHKGRIAALSCAVMIVVFVTSMLAGCTSSVAVSDDLSNKIEASPSIATAASGSSKLDRLRNLVTKTDMYVSIAYTTLYKPEVQYSVNGDRAQKAASEIKMIVLYAFYDLCNQGKASLDEKHTLTADEIVGGSGNLQKQPVGTVLTYGELAQLMIKDSDNTAANIIIDKVGIKTVNAYARKLGLTATVLNRKMMDIKEGVENYTSANDLNKLMSMIYYGTFVNKEYSKLALDALKQQSIKAGIGEGLRSIPFAHKTGTLEDAQNDSGIALLEDRPFVITVMCQKGEKAFSTDKALDLMRQVGKILA